MPALFAAALLALSLDAAAAKEPPVLVKPVGVENIDIGLSGGSFDLLLEAERTRGIRVRLRDLDYTVKMGGRVVTRGDREYSGKVLRKGQPIIIEVPVEFSATDALATGLDALTNGKVNVRIQGEAGLRVLLIPFSVPFDQKVKMGKGRKKRGRR